MEGVISNFRMTRRTQDTKNIVVIIDGVDTREKAAKLVGKVVTWVSPAGKELKGEVRSAHGKGGAVRVLFEKGMPGQSVGKKVRLS